MIVTGELIGRWVGAGAKVPWTNACKALGWVREGQPIAGCLYDGFSGGSVLMHCRVANPSRVSRLFYYCAFDYAFNEMKVKRVRGLVPADNEKALKLNSNLGWKRETVLKDYFTDCDGVLLYMAREDCRWLNIFKDKNDALRRMARAASQSFQNNDGSALWQTPVS